MSYSFKVDYNEDKMISYFKGASGKQIKDTLIVHIRNNGTKGWEPHKGSFKCFEEKSNIFFEEAKIAEEAYPNGRIEIVLNFPRTEKNNNTGNCFTTLQLKYKENEYNYVTINFKKNYDLSGNPLEKEENVPQKGGQNYFKPEELKEKLHIEEKNDEHSVILKFRSAFDLSKSDYSDEYLRELLEKTKNDFQAAIMLHLDKEDQKKEDIKNKAKTSQGLDELVQMFRKQYQLGKEDYPDDKLKQVLAKKQGNFENAFEELMSFIE